MTSDVPSPPPRDPSPLSEDSLLDEAREILLRHTADFPLANGDDVALSPPLPRGLRLAWTSDAMVEGTHFRQWSHAGRLDWLGWKLAASNLSDLASKGATPLGALFSLGIPRNARPAQVHAIFEGLDACLTQYHARLVGGDIVAAPQWTLNLALIGTLDESYAIAARSHAEPGMKVFVTGYPGRSGAGFRMLETGDVTHPSAPALLRTHLRPKPRLAAGSALVSQFQRIAMLDVSDGMARDGLRLATQSNVRIVLRVSQLPVAPPLKVWTDDRQLDPLEFVLHGGEDYELLFATHADYEQVAATIALNDKDLTVTEIGYVEEGSGLFLRQPDKTEYRLIPHGYEHFGT